MFESFEAFFIHVFWSRWRDNVPICQKQWVSFKLQARNHKYVDAWELLALFFFFHFFFSCHPLVRSQALRPSLSESNQKNCWPAIWRAKLFTLKILIAFLCLTPLSFWKKVLSYQIYQWATEIYQWATRIWIKSFALCIWMYKDICFVRDFLWVHSNDFFRNQSNLSSEVFNPTFFPPESGDNY